MTKARYLIAGVLVAAFAIAASTAHAGAIHEAAIEKRQGIMKGVGKATKTAQKMVKGKIAFDPAAAAGHMAVIAKAAVDVVPLFPVGSETGGPLDNPTTVLPAIWQNRQDFEARLANLAKDAKAAVAAAGQGPAAFKPAFIAMVKNNCKNCHDKYREKKK